MSLTKSESPTEFQKARFRSHTPDQCDRMGMGLAANNRCRRWDSTTVPVARNEPFTGPNSNPFRQFSLSVRQFATAMASTSPPRHTSTTRYRVRPLLRDYTAHTNRGSQGFCRKSRDGNRNSTWTDLPAAPIRGQRALMPALQRETHCRIRSG